MLKFTVFKQQSIDLNPGLPDYEGYALNPYNNVS